MKQSSFPFLKMFLTAYENIANDEPFASLRPYLEELSVKSSKKRQPGWDYEIIHYIFNKSLFQVKQAATVCVLDSGKIEYIYLTTFDYNHISEVLSGIDYDWRFDIIDENERNTLWSTPVERLYISIMKSPYGNNEHAVRISYGDLK